MSMPTTNPSLGQGGQARWAASICLTAPLNYSCSTFGLPFCSLFVLIDQLTIPLAIRSPRLTLGWKRGSIPADLDAGFNPLIFREAILFTGFEIPHGASRPDSPTSHRLGRNTSFVWRRRLPIAMSEHVANRSLHAVPPLVHEPGQCGDGEATRDGRTGVPESSHFPGRDLPLLDPAVLKALCRFADHGRRALAERGQEGHIHGRAIERARVDEQPRHILSRDHGRLSETGLLRVLVMIQTANPQQLAGMPFTERPMVQVILQRLRQRQQA